MTTGTHMLKDQMIEHLCNRLAQEGHTVTKNAVRALLDELAAVAIDGVSAGNDVTIPGIVKLAVQDRAARQGRNPHTGKAVTIPACRIVKAKPLKALRDAA